MDHMNRKSKIRRKKRLKQIMNGDYEKLDINETYMIATCDYDSQQLNGLIKDAYDKPPLWDWFTLVNKKKNKIWYFDFSTPYIWNEFLELSEETQKKHISNFWAIDDTPFKIKHNPIKGGMFKLDNDDPDYDSKLENRIQFYLENNDWNKTFNDFKEKNEFNLKWNDGVQLFRNDFDDWGIIIPHSYTNKTFLDVFTEVILKFNQCKINQESHKLIKEIPFTKFLN